MDKKLGHFLMGQGDGCSQGCERHRSVTGFMLLSDHNFIFSLISVVLFRLNFKLTYVSVSYVGRTH